MNIFNYNSKFSQTLMFLGDLCLLNLSYVLCCLPIFTIGAAQAALYTGLRVLQDPENDESPTKAFFKAFRTGFGPITGASLIFLVLEFLFVSLIYGLRKHQVTLPGLPLWLPLVAMGIVMLFHAQVPLFHSRFSCTAFQLIRNSLLLVLAHPIRSLLTAILFWIPFGVFVWDMQLFATIIPVWVLLYFSVAFLLNFNIMKKPFRVLIDHYNETHDVDGNPILPTMDEDGDLVYENSIQDKLDAESAARAKEAEEAEECEEE